jgi:hypothetical protein
MGQVAPIFSYHLSVCIHFRSDNTLSSIDDSTKFSHSPPLKRIKLAGNEGGAVQNEDKLISEVHFFYEPPAPKNRQWLPFSGPLAHIHHTKNSPTRRDLSYIRPTSTSWMLIYLTKRTAKERFCGADLLYSGPSETLVSGYQSYFYLTAW